LARRDGLPGTILRLALAIKNGQIGELELLSKIPGIVLRRNDGSLHIAKPAVISEELPSLWPAEVALYTAVTVPSVLIVDYLTGKEGLPLCYWR